MTYRNLLPTTLLGLVVSGCLLQPPNADPSPLPTPSTGPSTTPVSPEPSVQPTASPVPVEDRSVLVTVVGAGPRGVSHGGDATKVNLDRPVGLAIDPKHDRLTFAEAGTNRVRQLMSSGGLNTLVGAVDSGFAGDGESAGGGRLAQPMAVAYDLAGHLYIADWGNRRIRKVDVTTNRISTVAGNGSGAYDAQVADATRVALTNPTAVAVDPQGRLLIVDTGNHVIRRVDADGKIMTIAGTGFGGDAGDGGPGMRASLRSPSGIAVDRAGNIYIADTGNHRLRRLAVDGTIATVAGTGVAGAAGDGGPAIEAQLNGPYHLAMDAAGRIYISEPTGYRIRCLSPDGQLTTVAGTGQPYTVGASGTADGEGGPATKAALAGPTGLVVDRAGDLYFSDAGDRFGHRIRKITFQR